MSYLNDLESELSATGIPARRRRRILAEFADHLHENPTAELGAPRELARQFADELGTRLARATALTAFVALAMAGTFLVVMFFAAGRLHGWLGVGDRGTGGPPGWWLPAMVVTALAAQVALASGLLAALRAWRLRREHVISAADAAILNRRAAVGLVSGAITMMVLPLTPIGITWTKHALWNTTASIGGPVAIALLLSMLPSVLAAARLRPQRPGVAGDLRLDLGTHDARVTPCRAALVLSGVILVALAVTGVAADDPYDGIARGLLDGAACMTGFIVLGRYLGLRAAS